MKKTKNSYKKSGVNIELANRFVKHIAKVSKKNVKNMNSASNKDNIGAFGSIFDISNIKIKDPLIVSCTDGVGTKLDLANRFKIFDTIGIDLVAMCVNDLIVQGAKPLFFLDYIRYLCDLLQTGQLQIARHLPHRLGLCAIPLNRNLYPQHQFSLLHDQWLAQTFLAIEL